MSPVFSREPTNGAKVDLVQRNTKARPFQELKGPPTPLSTVLAVGDG